MLQFQFAERLCKIADPNSPLHRCDFSGSVEAGKALAKMLQLGSSLPWPEVLNVFTGSKEMSVNPLLAFFEPLTKWLEKENKINQDVIGWKQDDNLTV